MLLGDWVSLCWEEDFRKKELKIGRSILMGFRCEHNVSSFESMDTDGS